MTDLGSSYLIKGWRLLKKAQSDLAQLAQVNNTQRSLL